MDKKFDHMKSILKMRNGNVSVGESVAAEPSGKSMKFNLKQRK